MTDLTGSNGFELEPLPGTVKSKSDFENAHIWEWFQTGEHLINLDTKQKCTMLFIFTTQDKKKHSLWIGKAFVY